MQAPSDINRQPDRAELDKLLKRATLTPEELWRAQIFPLGRSGVYAALERGEIESVRIGKKLFVLTAPLRRKLGLEVA